MRVFSCLDSDLPNDSVNTWFCVCRPSRTWSIALTRRRSTRTWTRTGVSVFCGAMQSCEKENQFCQVTSIFDPFRRAFNNESWRCLASPGTNVLSVFDPNPGRLVLVYASAQGNSTRQSSRFSMFSHIKPVQTRDITRLL